MSGISTIESFTKPSPPTQSHAPPANATVTLVGNWGPWQRRNVLLIFLCKIPAAWFMACIIFTAPFAKTNEFMCNDTYDGGTIDGYHHNTNETSGNSEIIVKPVDSELDICELVFQVNDQNERFNEYHMDSNATIPCKQIRHESIFSSLVTDFDLVCSRTILIAVTQFFHLCGVLSGGILATKLLEMYVVQVFVCFLFLLYSTCWSVLCQFN